MRNYQKVLGEDCDSIKKVKKLVDEWCPDEKRYEHMKLSKLDCGYSDKTSCWDCWMLEVK